MSRVVAAFRNAATESTVAGAVLARHEPKIRLHLVRAVEARVTSSSDATKAMPRSALRLEGRSPPTVRSRHRSQRTCGSPEKECRVARPCENSGSTTSAHATVRALATRRSRRRSGERTVFATKMTSSWRRDQHACKLSRERDTRYKMATRSSERQATGTVALIRAIDDDVSAPGFVVAA